MDEPARRAQVAAVLRGAGARFAFVHGSRAHREFLDAVRGGHGR